jgi:hypothetical protein
MAELIRDFIKTHLRFRLNNRLRIIPFQAHIFCQAHILVNLQHSVMVALGNHAVILICIFQQGHSKHLIEVVLSDKFVIFPRLALIVLAVWLRQQLAAPFVDLLSLLDEAIMELRIDVYLAIVGLIVIKQLQFGFLLAILLDILVIIVDLKHIFEVFLTLGFCSLYAMS